MTEEKTKIVLAGDIGGTKANLAVLALTPVFVPPWQKRSSQAQIIQAWKFLYRNFFAGIE
ncbi:hypothetical protein TRIP_B330227 [uncultured Desulfatiglans sp.]|nr:hypothetical protein TRIP_B330227 [uncultured Desulfatiglans sp.]